MKIILRKNLYSLGHLRWLLSALVLLIISGSIVRLLFGVGWLRFLLLGGLFFLLRGWGSWPLWLWAITSLVLWVSEARAGKLVPDRALIANLSISVAGSGWDCALASGGAEAHVWWAGNPLVLILNVTLAGSSVEGVALLALAWSAVDAILHAVAAGKALSPTVIPAADGINNEVGLSVTITGEWILLKAPGAWGIASNFALASAVLLVQEKTASVVANLVSAVGWLVTRAGRFVELVAVLALLEVSGGGVSAGAVIIDLVALLAGKWDSGSSVASAVITLGVALSAGERAVTISILLVLGTLVGVIWHLAHNNSNERD